MTAQERAEREEAALASAATEFFGAAAALPAPKPGLKSSELWLVLTSGGAITEIAMRGDGPTLEQALCCVALAIVVGAYSVSRALAKRAPR